MKKRSTNKEKFYKKYVSAHNAQLYGEIDIDYIRRQFPAWDCIYRQFLPKNKDASIVDLGCGNGGLVFWLQENGYRNAEGLDISGEQIEQGRSLGIKNIRQGDLVIFLKNKKLLFDVILLRDVLGHFEKREVPEILELVYASLKAGGLIIVKVPNAESPFSGRLRHGDFTHDTSFTGTSLRQILLIAGFKEITLYSMRPIIHGLKSLVRFCLWLMIEGIIRFCRLAEAGTGQGIFTQSVMAVARK